MFNSLAVVQCKIFFSPAFSPVNEISSTGNEIGVPSPVPNTPNPFIPVRIVFAGVLPGSQVPLSVHVTALGGLTVL